MVSNQSPSTPLLNVCISTDNANTERVQAQDTDTINRRTMKGLAITRSHKKPNNPKGGTKTRPTTSFSLRRAVAHERTSNTLLGMR